MAIDVITRTAYNDIDYLSGNYWEPCAEEEHYDGCVTTEYPDKPPFE